VKELLIIGAGGFGREVAWLVDRINQRCPTWNQVGFLDDTPDLYGKLVNAHPVVGKCADYVKYPDAYLSVCVADANARKRLITILCSVGAPRFATLIDPSSLYSDSALIGEGCIICAHTILTVNISIKSHCIINLDCTIGHDVSIDDYVTLYPSVNISGYVNIGSCTEIGTGTQIIQHKSIGEQTIIGAGSVVVKDIPSHCTAVGCPAKPIKHNTGNRYVKD
jgi:sugar O-acyltransferase (sialic acid O-acetyltransferase NeuD family)